MAGLQDIRRRIRSVKNTQQVTKAMKMISAARLRRAQDAITHARPFALELGSLLRRVVARMDGTVERVLIEPGRAVKAGELLLTIR